MSDGLRALVAEDHQANQRLIEAILGAAGIEATVVETGVLAVEATAHERYHFILMDIQLPDMDGISATRAIRDAEAREGRPRTPILAVTACSLDEIRDAAVDAGVDDYVVKPVIAPALLHAIIRQLEKADDAA